MSLLLAAVHLVSLVFGVAALVLRATALQRAEDEPGARRVLQWDNAYGLVALFWIGSGLLRAFAGFEKGSAYYLANHVFWAKMLLVLVFVAVESVPMAAFIRWRVRLAKKQPLDLAGKARLVRLHWIELGLLPLIVVAASSLARGVGAPSARAEAAVTPADVAAGEVVYRTQCSTCHQPDGRGIGGKLAADFVGDRARLAKSDEALLLSIANGVPGTAMLGFQGRLSVAEQRQVLAYVRATFGSAR